MHTWHLKFFQFWVCSYPIKLLQILFAKQFSIILNHWFSLKLNRHALCKTWRCIFAWLTCRLNFIIMADGICCFFVFCFFFYYFCDSYGFLKSTCNNWKYVDWKRFFFSKWIKTNTWLQNYSVKKVHVLSWIHIL